MTGERGNPLPCSFAGGAMNLNLNFDLPMSTAWGVRKGGEPILETQSFLEYQEELIREFLLFWGARLGTYNSRSLDEMFSFHTNRFMNDREILSSTFNTLIQRSISHPKYHPFDDAVLRSLLHTLSTTFHNLIPAGNSRIVARSPNNFFARAALLLYINSGVVATSHDLYTGQPATKPLLPSRRYWGDFWARHGLHGVQINDTPSTPKAKIFGNDLGRYTLVELS